MNKTNAHKKISRGTALWHASRLKPVVQKLGSKNQKKKPQTTKKRR